MLVFFLVATSWILSPSGSINSRIRADKVTATALAHAKEALIGRAAADNNRPGSLPCPDTDDDGKADGDFGYCSASVGRLPWATLDLPDPRDGDGNRLWYALADELRDNEDAYAINPSLSLGLSVDGIQNIAAIVFSSGPPLTGQNSRPSNDVADYLDGPNKTGGPYISGPSSTSFNDKLLAISREQLFNVVNRRIIGLLRIRLNKYYNDEANNYSYPEVNSDLKTALTPYFDILNIDDVKAKKLLEDNDWYSVTNHVPETNRKKTTLSISTPPTISCAITPTQMSCTYP